MRAGADPARSTFGGGLRVFLAEALIFPTGMLTVAFLTRRLGPDGYGAFSLAVAMVAWIEWSISSLFSRAAVRFVSEAADWRPVATAVGRLYLSASLVAAALLFVLADPIARAVDAPGLGRYLRLFSADIPLFGLAHAQRCVLIGTGEFSHRALMSAWRWVSRLVLIVLLVEMGLSGTGAVLGAVGASAVELGVGRLRVRLGLLASSRFPWRRFLGYAVPLSLGSLCLQLYGKMDLWFLKALGGTLAEAGMYGAAQNLTLVPGIIALSFSPLLLSRVTRLLQEGDEAGARRLGLDALRAAVWVLPVGGMIAGSAGEIVRLVFGAAYLPASLPVAVLIFSGLALVVLSACAALLTALGRPRWVLLLAGPLVPLSAAGLVVAIPRGGMVGAAGNAVLWSSLVALAALAVVRRQWGIAPPAATVVRSALACVPVAGLAWVWPTPGLAVLLKLPVLAVLAAGVAWATGELKGVCPPWSREARSPGR